MIRRLSICKQEAENLGRHDTRLRQPSSGAKGTYPTRRVAHMTHEFHSYGNTIPIAMPLCKEIEKAIAWARRSQNRTVCENAHSEVDRL